MINCAVLEVEVDIAFNVTSTCPALSLQYCDFAQTTSINLLQFGINFK